MAGSWDLVARRGAETVSEVQGRGHHGPVVRADTRPYHEAGASEAQELAAALATGLAYLRALEAGGHALAAARDALSFLLVADADEFLTVAKFRALRRLWARVEEACGLAPKPIRLHAETAWRMTTRRDPWVNMLRTTLAVFSAGIGGADGVTALPFTAALGLPDAFARRIARNTQLILLDEAHVARVEDPVAGAGGFEALTDALCESAWALLQEVEREGGIVTSLESGALQARIAAVRAKREWAAATRRDPITGTSAFPDLDEAAVQVLLPSRPPPDGPAVGTGAIASLPSRRIAEPYERLGDASDAQLARTGARPRVFLASLGPVNAFTERAAFARNFFAAGWIEAVGGGEPSSPETIAAAFAGSGAKLACLCSSDEIYARLAEPSASALWKAGAHGLYVVGHSERLEEHLGHAGVTAYLVAGCDAVAILEDAFERAGS
jgi:methylmalonyl-CoA mutase